MPRTIPARPTTYRGIPMRSRLEARWAAFLDEWAEPYRDIGIGWEYEPRAFADGHRQYLPDFVITGLGFPIYYEVRPTFEAAVSAFEQMQIILASEPNAELRIVVSGGPMWAKDPGDIWRVYSRLEWFK